MPVMLLLEFFSPTMSQSTGYSSDSMSTAQMPTVNQLVVEPLTTFFLAIMSYVPYVLTAVCILASGWVVGRVLQLVVSSFLGSIGFDKFASKAGIEKLLNEGGGKIVPHRWFGQLTFWVAIFVSIISCLDQLRLRLASTELATFLHFVLTVSTGLVIFLIGIFLSIIFSKIVRSVAASMNVTRPDLYAVLAKWSVLAFTFLFCLMQIGMTSQIVLVAVGLVAATFCATFVMAFGVGGAGWAAKVLEKTLKEQK